MSGLRAGRYGGQGSEAAKPLAPVHRSFSQGGSRIAALDWTRIGHTYCLAGVIVKDGRLRVVRPLPARSREGPVRNVGWSP